MTLRLHHVPGARSMRVLWLLEELGLESELVLHSLTDGGLRAPQFRAISPAARVPALEIDGRVIAESGAIVQYLTEREGRLAPPPGSPERAAFLEWVHLAETQANILQALNIQHIFLRPAAARSVPLMRLETRRLALSAEGIEARLAGRESLLASGFSAADCMMGFNLDALFRFLPEAEFPALAAYGRAMRARPAYRAAEARSGPGTIYTEAFYPLPPA